MQRYQLGREMQILMQKSINFVLFIRSNINFIYFYLVMWTYNKQSKVTAATIDGYSKNSNYKETFFHYPTRNPHCELQYQRRRGNQPTNTFRMKGKTQFQQHMYESSLNPFSHHKSHYEKQANITGDRKKPVNFYSNKATDPVTLTYEPYKRQTKINNTYTPSNAYKMQVQRRDYLPAERQLSKSRRLYHSQIGFLLSARDTVKPRQIINNSSTMRSTIQYQEHKEMNRSSCFDDLRYNSKK